MKPMLSVTMLIFFAVLFFGCEAHPSPSTPSEQITALTQSAQQKYDAKEVLIGVVQASDGKVLYLDGSGKNNNISTTTNYFFEPGSAIKPLLMAQLFDTRVHPSDIVDTHNGRYHLGKKIITDRYPEKRMSAENVLIRSSNIGMVVLTQRLSGKTYHDTLTKFGFGGCTDTGHCGKIPSERQLNAEIYKAIVSYGYGLRVNFDELFRAYSIISNNGVNGDGERILSADTAEQVRNILIKNVEHGTGVQAAVDDVVSGGKTGTAHIAENGKYVEKYNSSFFGFAELKGERYTIGVLVIDPKGTYLASQVAAPIFADIVNVLRKTRGDAILDERF